RRTAPQHDAHPGALLPSRHHQYPNQPSDIDHRINDARPHRVTVRTAELPVPDAAFGAFPSLNGS
ncbi:hypothetical protein PV405_35420, partial [Streptomyces sp. ME02-6979-3A]|uniref:hypothetical protein n=1 Tax=Streptomyces sp. ME02-6979-3A TaxID=3028673 RepID=UPI0029B3FD98